MPGNFKNELKKVLIENNNEDLVESIKYYLPDLIKKLEQLKLTNQDIPNRSKK